MNLIVDDKTYNSVVQIRATAEKIHFRQAWETSWVTIEKYKTMSLVKADYEE